MPCFDTVPASIAMTVAQSEENCLENRVLWVQDPPEAADFSWKRSSSDCAVILCIFGLTFVYHIYVHVYAVDDSSRVSTIAYALSTVCGNQYSSWSGFPGVFLALALANVQYNTPSIHPTHLLSCTEAKGAEITSFMHSA